MGRLPEADGELIHSQGNNSSYDVSGEKLGWKDANIIGDKGVADVCRILKGKHEIKTHTAGGKGPSGMGWRDTGCFIVEVEAKDTRGNIRPSGIFAPDLADEDAFWNDFLDDDGVVSRFYSSVGTMRAFINDLRKKPHTSRGYDRCTWSGNGGRAHNCKVELGVDVYGPEIEVALRVMKEHKEQSHKKLKERYKRYSIDWCK